MKPAFIIFEIWTIMSFIGLILIYFRKDAHLVFEDWKTVKAKRNIFSLIITIFLVYFILPFSIPYSLAHIGKK
jgi:hypothetical protein